MTDDDFKKIARIWNEARFKQALRLTKVNKLYWTLCCGAIMCDDNADKSAQDIKQEFMHLKHEEDESEFVLQTGGRQKCVDCAVASAGSKEVGESVYAYEKEAFQEKIRDFDHTQKAVPHPGFFSDEDDTELTYRNVYFNYTGIGRGYLFIITEYT